MAIIKKEDIDLHIKNLDKAYKKVFGEDLETQEETKRLKNLFEVKSPFSGPIAEVLEEFSEKRSIFRNLESDAPYWGALPPPIEVIESLYPKFPNFKTVIDKIKLSSVLYHNDPEKRDRLFTLPHLLLVGPPSAGKTYFMQTLSELSGISFKSISLSGVSNAGLLTGTQRTWKNSTVGGIAHVLADGRIVNGIVLLDELDKTEVDQGIYEILHNLLEQKTAKTTTDYCLGSSIEIDASNLIYVATANSTKNMPESLLSRMTVVNIEKIKKSQMGTIFSNMLQIEVLKKHQLEGRVNLLVEGVNDISVSCQKTLIVSKEVVDLLAPAEDLRKVREILSTKVAEAVGFYLFPGKTNIFTLKPSHFDQEDFDSLGFQKNKSFGFSL